MIQYDWNKDSARTLNELPIWWQADLDKTAQITTILIIGPMDIAESLEFTHSNRQISVNYGIDNYHQTCVTNIAGSGWYQCENIE